MKKILFAVDCSSSADYSILCKIYNKIKEMDEFNSENELVFFNTSIFAQISSKNLSSFEHFKEMAFLGSFGGTDLTDVKNYAEFNSFSKTIIFTDGYLTNPEASNLLLKNEKIKYTVDTLFMITEKSHLETEHLKAPFEFI